MNSIELQKINKFYGDNHVLKDVDLSIEDGDFMTLLGPSGCGKTTTLRVIAGLERPQSGEIWMGGKQVVNAAEEFFLPPSKRGLNLVFQSYALWPHMTVFQNVAFGLKAAKKPKNEIKTLVEGALERMQIASLQQRYPSELSGGQQQRVAIARAIASAPRLLLLDEPLSNLDAKLRIDMRGELKRLHRDMGTTIIYVTHDQAEALTLSTRIAVFFDGKIEQVAAPMTVYRNPASLRVADFIGNPRINTLNVAMKQENGGIVLTSPLGTFAFSKDELCGQPEGTEAAIGFRPEEVVLTREARDGAKEMNVYSAMPAGSETLIQLSAGEERFLVKQLGIRRYQPDEKVYVSLRPKLINVFNGADGKLIKNAAEDEIE